MSDMLSFVPPDWQANLGAGILLMVIELIIVYLLIAFLISQVQKRSENRLWKLARREFVAKMLFSLANGSYRSFLKRADGSI